MYAPKNQRGFYPHGFSVITGLLVLGCSASPSTPPGAVSAPRVAFTWEAPQACSRPATVPVTFAVVRPVWQTVAGSGTMLDAAAMTNPQVAVWIRPRQDLYDEFALAMRNDFFAMLTCKGFTTRGPFASYQEMVFPDRIGSDLVMAPEIDIRLAVRAEPVSASLGTALLGVALGVRGGPSCTLAFPQGEGADAPMRPEWFQSLRAAMADSSYRLDRGAWYSVRLQLFPDGRCGIAVNGRPIQISNTAARSTDLFRALVQGSSVGTRVLVGQVTLRTGVPTDMEWQNLRFDGSAWRFARDGRGTSEMPRDRR